MTFLADKAIDLGLNALVTRVDGIALGTGSVTNGFQGVAISANALSLLEADVAIGRFARAGALGDLTGSNTAFGDRSVASGGFASAFGANTTVIGPNTTAIGSNSSTTTPGAVVVGSG